MDCDFSNFSFLEESNSFLDIVLQRKHSRPINNQEGQTKIDDNFQYDLPNCLKIEFQNKVDQHCQRKLNGYFDQSEQLQNLEIPFQQRQSQNLQRQKYLYSGSINQYEERQFYQNDNSKSQKKEKSKAGTKNILVNFKSHFIVYIIQNYPGAKNDKFLKDFKAKSCINRKDYQQLFSIEKYRNTIRNMFEERYLQREFQISRASFDVRDTYLRKIPVFKKAFELRKFPRIC